MYTMDLSQTKKATLPSVRAILSTISKKKPREAQQKAKWRLPLRPPILPTPENCQLITPRRLQYQTQPCNDNALPGRHDAGPHEQYPCVPQQRTAPHEATAPQYTPQQLRAPREATVTQHRTDVNPLDAGGNDQRSGAYELATRRAAYQREDCLVGAQFCVPPQAPRPVMIPTTLRHENTHTFQSGSYPQSPRSSLPLPQQGRRLQVQHPGQRPQGNLDVLRSASATTFRGARPSEVKARDCMPMEPAFPSNRKYFSSSPLNNRIDSQNIAGGIQLSEDHATDQRPHFRSQHMADGRHFNYVSPTPTLSSRSRGNSYIGVTNASATDSRDSTIAALSSSTGGSPMRDRSDYFRR